MSGSSAIELVALNLRTIRREKGLTQEALAANARVARHLIAKIETEVHANPTLELLDRIAQALGANTAELFRDMP
jgi:transcriptional regulator with XRE-family HTH domain